MSPDYEYLSTLFADDRFETIRAHRTRTGSAVLVKRARRSANAGADLAALQREVAIAASLSSRAELLPRVVESEGRAVLVMEDPGGELLPTLLRGPRLPIETVITVATHIAGLLAELHGRGILHNGICADVILCDIDEPRAWLIDAGHTGRAAIQHVLPADVVSSAARLVYMSPEQTGRMDRATDARSDLYSLGIVLYELLTGAPPLRSGDPLEQIHWHIAGIAREPSEVDPTIPPVLSDLTMKLLAKNPEDRYQSADGLMQDLTRCAREWSANSAIEPFALGHRDAGAQLIVSSRLYGREGEVRVLLEAFEQTCAGRGSSTMMLVQGYAGIGKTSLIQQLVRPIVRQKGYFISGKFDQVMRGVPFGALIQAFRGLVRQMLTESEDRLAAWRESLTKALGSNGGVLAEVIPEIEFVMGTQATPSALGGTEAQNRFQRVLQQFLAALAQPEHPLVLFLDDLQWADAATLALLEPLLTSSDIRCLMLLGAYRDSETDGSARLGRTLGALGVAGVSLRHVSLGPLQLGDLTRLVADTLRSGIEQAEPLARLVFDKTGGNPFFVIQFLRMLERDGHLRFDPDAACWAYRIEQLADVPLADNVIELMTRSIQRLPAKAQYALTMAACIGNRFDLHTLAIVSEQSLASTGQDLELALAEGLIVGTAQPMSDQVANVDEPAASFAFLHDRVQQSAYALIPAERREMVHLTVGRLLSSRASPEQIEASLFDVVHHLNLGRGLIRDSAEQRKVAALNLSAGRRAKSSTAHDAALELFRCGVELIDASGCANDDDELGFELRLEAAESQYLCGQFEAALQAFDGLVIAAPTPIDRARAIRLRSVQYENMARYDDALASAREGLALFGVSFPRLQLEKAAALDSEIADIDSMIGARKIAALIELPVMKDASTRMVMTMLTDMWSAAYILGDSMLARLISATMVRLSLKHGNVEESAYGYVTHAITVGPVRGHYQSAYEFGCLALEVNRRFDDSRRRAKIFQQFHAHVNLWCRPMHTCMAYAREACRSGLDSGDFLYAAYGAGTETWSAIVAAQDLSRFVRDYAPSVALIERLKNTGFADSVRLILNWARAMQGLTAAPLSLSDESFDEQAYLRTYRDNPFFATIHAVARLHLSVLLGTPTQALEAAMHSAALVHHVPGTVWPVIHDFWHAVALSASLDTASDADRSARLSQIERARSGFAKMAEHCAENFKTQALLLAAELARIDGRNGDAVGFYEEAIEFASAGPLIQYQALAHELYARFRIERGQQRLALMHLEVARGCYRRWGAIAKVVAMIRQYPLLAIREHDAATPSTEAGVAPEGATSAHADADEARLDALDGLDLSSVLKATQAIAAEVELAGLLARLIHVAIENAGAEQGALVLESEAGPRVYSSGLSSTDARTEVGAGVALDSSQHVPIGIVNYVRRTGQIVVLANAEADEHHGSDAYVVRHRPRSVACLPVSKQGRSIGVLYLENRRVGAVFTPQRLHTLRIIATQAAISVENARLFEGLKIALAEVDQLKEDLETENSFLRRDLIANVSHDLRTPLVSMRGYLEVMAAKGDSLSVEQREQYLGIAVRQGERLGTLIDELFELAKLDFKGMRLMREPFQFDELAVDVIQKFELAAVGKGIDLRVDADPGLPMVHADLSLMERVLENLIGNALQHTPPGGAVKLRLCERGGSLCAQVCDTGSGIAPSELPFIFDRFYRGANGRRRESEGAGLGLAITKRIMELHGNAITVESDERSGTCFTLTLSLAQ